MQRGSEARSLHRRKGSASADRRSWHRARPWAWHPNPASGGLERLRRCLFDPRLAAGDIVEQEFRLNTSPGAEECLNAFGRYIADEIDNDVVGIRLRELAMQIPCLVVWGADDKVLPSTHGLEMQSAIGRSSRFVAIKRCGHAPYFEKPWEFNQILLNFLGMPTSK